MGRVTILAPASTSNLGPGFDVFGMAFALWATLRFEQTESGLVIRGCEEKYATAENLAIVGYDAVCERIGKKRGGLKVAIESDIPACRGLGSSAAILVAGAFAANALYGSPLSRMEILGICTAIEGHPDNVSAAILGGLTVSMVDRGVPYTVRCPVHPSIGFVALIPAFESLTSLARAALSPTISREDAVFNISRATVLIKALETGDRGLISIAVDDRMHVDCRAKLIPAYDELKALALRTGCLAFTISGAGGTCLCVGADAGFAERITPELSRFSGGWQAMPLAVEPDGARILDWEA